MRKALICVLLLSGCQKDELSDAQREEVISLIESTSASSQRETEQSNSIDELHGRVDDLEFSQAIK